MPVRPEPIGRRRKSGIEGWVRSYFLTIFKNVVGWLLIVGAPIIGIALPGPGGIPIFILGFAMVTFPGKRKLTTHFFRGRRLPIESAAFTGLITFVSVVLTATLMLLTWRFRDFVLGWLPEVWGLSNLRDILALIALSLPVTMLTIWIALKIVNGVLPWVPKGRRLVRRALRKWGVRLLPTRRRRIGGKTEFVQDEILGLDEPQRKKLRRMGIVLMPWLKRLTLVLFVVGVVFLIVEPVINEWNDVQKHIGRLEIPRFISGIALYGVGLLMFRVTAWRHILFAYGHRLPARATARIWSLGYLARYIPGHTYEILRMELTRRYGPSGVQANSSQKLEATLAGVAAFAVGLAALLGVAQQHLPSLRPMWIGLGVILAAVLFIAVPLMFYRVLPDSGILARRGGEHLGQTRVPRRTLSLILGWHVAGTALRACAAILVIGQPLGGSSSELAIIGAFAFAMSAAQFASWAPGGIGVRELVFVGLISLMLPDSLKATFENMPVPTFDPTEPRSWQSVWWAFLFFLALVLRIATTTAEFVLAVAAVIVDWKEMVRIARNPIGYRHRRAPPMIN